MMSDTGESGTLESSVSTILDSTLGKGTTVRIYLPEVALSEHAAARDVDAQVVGDGNAQILVVEDDPQMRELLSSALRDDGFDVLNASSTEEAMTAMSSHMPAILVTDVILPGTLGTDWAASVRQSNRSLPILIISRESEDSMSSVEWAPDPKTRFLAKPFRTKELLASVYELLSAAA